MLGLTQLGLIHTAISLVAVGAGAFGLIRDKKLTLNNGVGKLYVITTALTSLTGFGIFQHGGFGAPHVLGIITLIVLAVAATAGKGRIGAASPYIETVSYSATFFFHMIPAFTETSSRFPLGAPLVADRDHSPGLQAAIGICFVLFLIGATLQVLRLRKQRS